MDSFDEPTADAAGKTASPRRPLHFGLRGLLLFTTLVAVWGTDYRNRRAIERVESRLSMLRPMAPELVVDDPSLIAIVHRPPLGRIGDIWDVYLPRANYRLHLATESIDQSGTAPVDAVAALPQGLMKIELVREEDGNGWSIAVLLDEREVLAVNKPAEWWPRQERGHRYGKELVRDSTGGAAFSRQAERQPDESAVMFRSRFHIPDTAGRFRTPAEPAAGLLLWIEPAD